ncbi:unnamed protein product [Cutaneotrichosporon oleaginosum]
MSDSFQPLPTPLNYILPPAALSQSPPPFSLPPPAHFALPPRFSTFPTLSKDAVKAAHKEHARSSSTLLRAKRARHGVVKNSKADPRSTKVYTAPFDRLYPGHQPETPLLRIVVDDSIAIDGLAELRRRRRLQRLEFDLGSNMRESDLELANKFLFEPRNFRRTLPFHAGGWYLSSSSAKGASDYLMTRDGITISTIELKPPHTSIIEGISNQSDAYIGTDSRGRPQSNRLTVGETLGVCQLLLEFQRNRVGTIFYGNPSEVIAVRMDEPGVMRVSKPVTAQGRLMTIQGAQRLVTPMALWISAAFVDLPPSTLLLPEETVNEITCHTSTYCSDNSDVPGPEPETETER